LGKVLFVATKTQVVGIDLSGFQPIRVDGASGNGYDVQVFAEGYCGARTFK
jgi:hypothetical protein